MSSRVQPTRDTYVNVGKTPTTIMIKAGTGRLDGKGLFIHMAYSKYVVVGSTTMSLWEGI